MKNCKKQELVFSKKLLFTALLMCGFSSFLYAQSENQQELSDIFSKFAVYDPQYTQPAKLSSSGFSFTKAYSTSYGAESNRPWNNTNVESDLFMARLTYTDANPNLSYQASVSTGGGLYSYRNSNGECMPKQRGAAANILADGTYYNQWTESVWHMVGNNVEHQGNAQAPIKDKIIFHQGGAYGNIAETGYKPFYGFQLADYYNSALEEYSTVAWLQIGHPKATRDSDFYTEILIWTKYRNVGNGILQVDQALYNFGDHTTGDYGNDFRTPVLDRINAPYTCNNDDTHNRLYMSLSNGTYTENTGQGWGTTTNNTNTDGWVAFIAGQDQVVPGAGYGFIFNNDAGTNKFGYVNAAKAQNNFTAIRTDTDIYQGDLVNYRYFIALGNNVNAIQSAGSTYQDHTRHELRNIPKAQADDVSYYFEKSASNTITAATATGASQGLDLKLQPYENSFPIFIVTNSSGVSQVTSDLYAAVRAANPNEMWPWNGVTTDIKLLGFSDSRATVNNFETVTINSGDSYTFPDGTTINNITSDLYKISFTGTTSTSTPNADYSQYTQTHIQVSGNTGGGGTNLALNGTATQSTTLNGRGPELAIDGNTNGNYGSGSVTVAQGPNAWWEVDLGGSYSIDDINVFNRTNSCCTSRLSNFTVSVKDSNGNVTFSETITSAPNPSETIDAGGAVGQIVRIQSNLTDNLNLAEVEVSGELATNSAFIPDPNKTYYIDCPAWNLRLAASGESEDAYTTSTSTTGDDVAWKFVDNGNGYWHIDRAAGGTKPRLRTDGTADADMNQTAANGTNTYYSFSEGASSGTYFLTLPDGTVDYNRLQIDNTGAVKMTGTSSIGTWVSFTITEATSVSCATFSTIQAESFNSMSGIVTESTSDTGGGQHVGFIENGDWVSYSTVDLTCATSIEARVSSNTSGGNIEVRLDGVSGTLIGTIPVSNTGGWNSWTTVSTNLNSISGTHDVYLVFTGGSGYLLNLNWIEFSGSSQLRTISNPETPEPLLGDIEIYPNPAKSTLIIELAHAETANMSIVNNAGQIMLSRKINGNSASVDISSLSPGFYIIRVSNEHETIRRKIIKE